MEGKRAKRAQFVLLLMAGGRGRRFSPSQGPKQLLRINKKPIYIHALKAFLGLANLRSIVVVHPKGLEGQFRDELKSHCPDIDVGLVCGGSERFLSVAEGLRFAASQESLDANAWVLVHDAVRPCVHGADLALLVEQASKAHDEGTSCGVVPVSPVANTIKVVSKEGLVKEHLQREALVEASTPQVFPLLQLKQAYDLWFSSRDKEATPTDDAEVFSALDKPVVVVPTKSPNPKLTRKEDLLLVNRLLK